MIPASQPCLQCVLERIAGTRVRSTRQIIEQRSGEDSSRKLPKMPGLVLRHAIASLDKAMGESMTAQEIYEREGFLVMYSKFPVTLGQPTTAPYGCDRLGIPEDTKLVPISEISPIEAQAYYERNGMEDGTGIRGLIGFLFYKVIAE